MIYTLMVTCTLENVTSFGVNQEKFSFPIKVHCANCKEVSANYLYICVDEFVCSKKGPGQVNACYKCKLCGTESTISYVPNSLRKIHKEDLDALVSFDFRGCVPMEFLPSGEWDVSTEGASIPFQAKFEEIGPCGSSWSDYDENNGRSIGIFDLKTKFYRGTPW